MLGKLLLVSLSLSSALTVKEQVAAPALRLRGGSALTPAAAGALYHGFFGAGLYISPDMFGDKSVLSYVKDVEGPVGGFFGRGFGAMMLGAGLAYLVEPEATVLTPLYAIIMTLFTPLLAKRRARPPPPKPTVAEDDDDAATTTSADDSDSEGCL